MLYAARAIGIVMGAALFLVSCSDRQHDNPFDPANPRTGGRPTGLSLLATAGHVRVSWPVWQVEGIDSVIIYRRAAADSQFFKIGRIPGDQNEFFDTNISYGIRYEYYITVCSGSYSSPGSEVVATTPGPAYVWIADRASGYFSCVSYDLSQTLGKFGMMNFPCFVGPSPKEKAAWIYSRYTDEIYKINRAGRLISLITEMANVVDMKIDTLLCHVWVATSEPPQVIRLAADGSRIETIRQLLSPIHIAVDGLHQRVFVIDNSRRRVFGFETNGSLIAESPTLVSPQALALNESEQRIWIADSTRLIELDYQLRQTGVAKETFYHAALVAFDQKRQQGWLVDLEPTGVPASLSKFNRHGELAFTLARFGRPQCLAVDEFSGSCLLGDVGYGDPGCARVSEDGRSVELLRQWLLPYDIELEYF